MSDLISRSKLQFAIKRNQTIMRDGEHYIRLSAVLEKLRIAPAVDAVPVVHARWVLEESPYAEHEEAVDGESHPRYVCSNCHQEAGFTCDPDGFAGYQDLTKWCGNCHAKMDGGADA